MTIATCHRPTHVDSQEKERARACGGASEPIAAQNEGGLPLSQITLMSLRRGGGSLPWKAPAALMPSRRRHARTAFDFPARAWRALRS